MFNLEIYGWPYEDGRSANTWERTCFHKIEIGVTQFCLYLLTRHHCNVAVPNDGNILLGAIGGSKQPRRKDFIPDAYISEGQHFRRSNLDYVDRYNVSVTGGPHLSYGHICCFVSRMVPPPISNDALDCCLATAQLV